MSQNTNWFEGGYAETTQMQGQFGGQYPPPMYNGNQGYAQQPTQQSFGGNSYSGSNNYSSSNNNQSQFTSLGFDNPSVVVPQNANSSQSFASSFSGFLNTDNNNNNNTINGGKFDFSNEPPLLVELGINFNHIAAKTVSALHPLGKLDPQLMSDGDLAGPMVFCFIFGMCLLLVGKLHFGYVFGFGVVGSISMYVLLNLMTKPEKSIELHVVFSVLGYSLIPIILVAGIGIFLGLTSNTGLSIVTVGVAWCTTTATRFFEAILDAREIRYLIAYPTFLLFACFALITVF